MTDTTDNDNIVSFNKGNSPMTAQIPDEGLKLLELDGHTISLNQNYLFSLTGPYFVDSENFVSINDAKNALVRATEVAQKVKKSMNTVELRAYDKKGEQVIIRGVHGNTGKLLGADDDVYPRTDTVRALLREAASLSTQLQSVTGKLYPLRIKYSRTYGRINPASYDKIIAELHTDFEAATTKAAFLDAPKVISEAKE